jgi:anti-sigma factor RsiW
LSVDINISNYEEFLLSYIDGELNNEEQAAVEAFLQQHPEQAKELEVLKAAVLQPDPSIAFGNREELYHSTVITTENYETFFLSYIDGELNAAEQQALDAFLKKHPHLQQELDTWQATRLPASEGLRFDNKEMLYRHADTLTPENYETYLLSYIDGELSATEEQTLHAFLQQHPELRATLQLFERTRLQADPQLRMPGKAALYRNRARRIQPAWWWGAAAAVIAGCLVWLLPLQRDAVETAPLATTTGKAPASRNVQQLQKTSPAKPSIKVNLDDQQVQQAPAMTQNTPAAKPTNEPSTVKNIRPVKDRPLQPSVAANQPAANTGVNNNNNSTVALAQLPQPRATSAEVVQQHMEKTIQATTPPVQEVATVNADPDPVLASTLKLQHTPAPEVQPAAAPAVQGELIMSVTSTSESRLLNGVASVAKFFSKKKRQKSE